MPSKVPIKNQDELKALHTGTLMVRRVALLKCEASFSLSDRLAEDEPNPAETGFIEFKDTAEWKKAYAELKHVLAGREHIPRKND